MTEKDAKAICQFKAIRHWTRELRAAFRRRNESQDRRDWARWCIAKLRQWRKSQ